MAKDIGFENTIGATDHQAVAFRATYDMVIMDCLISGTVDFIFGDAASVFQNYLIIARKPGENQKNMITAHGRKFPYTHSTIVLQNCTISGAPNDLLKALARTIIMQSNIDDIITPEGYFHMEGTSYFVEFQNSGPGAKTKGKVEWPAIKKIDMNEAKKWTPGIFLEIETDK
ncbi:hypothetical protein GOBAR_DD18935 [Gossypium barbadense]|nr:hypothetical protein GOBAR_DD18935 [Gossypium barbadense]